MLDTEHQFLYLCCFQVVGQSKKNKSRQQKEQCDCGELTLDAWKEWLKK